MAIGSGLEKSYVLKPGEAAGSQEEKPEGLAGLVSEEINAPETNKGGFGAGLAYFGANIAAGAGSVFENIGTLIDTAALSLTGQGDLAEYKLKKESPIEGWLNDVTEEFNPDGFAQFMGGAAQGIGQSSAYIAASFIPYAGKFISGAMIFGSAGGAAMKDYVRETGELNGGAWAYTALSASLETAIEELLGFSFSKGLQSSVGTKITGNIAAKVFPKLARNAVAKGVGAYLWNAAGEGFEEMVSEVITPAFQLATGMKDTYDFSWGDFWYSGAVGAASAAMMGGASTAVNVSSNLRTGTRIAQNGKADMVYKAAALTTEQFANTAKMQEEIKMLKSAVADYAALENKNSATGRVLLGKMSKLMATVQTFTVVNRFSQVLRDEKAGAQYRKTWSAIVSDQLGITVTEQDLLENTTLEGEIGAADAAACIWYGAAFNAEYEAANRGLNATAMQDGGVYVPATEQAQDAQQTPANALGAMMTEEIEQETADVPISAEQNAGIPAPEEINTDVPVSEEQNAALPVPEENYRTDVPIAEGQNNVPAPEARDTILDTEAPVPDAESPVPDRTEEAPKQTETTSAVKKTKLVRSGNIHTYTLEEGKQSLQEVVEKTKNHPGSKYWSPDALEEFFLKYPDMDYISMLREQELGADIDADGAVKEFLALYDNAQELEDLSYYVGGIFIDKDRHVTFDFHTLEKKVEAPYRKATMKFRRMIKARIAEVGAAGGNVNLGIKSGKVTLDYVKDLYAKLNTNEEMQQLADKVFLVCGDLGVRFAFDNVIFDASTSKIANGATVGRNIRYKTNAFNSTAISNEEKANILLHEAIHSCVSYALVLNEKGELTDGDLREACRKLTDIFNDVRNSPTLRGEYGATTVNEMVAELSNPRFVEKMKQTTLWDRIVDAICNFFGITRKTDAYTNARAVLDYMLDNVSAYDYNAYANRQDNALRASNVSFTTEGADIRTEAATIRAERDAAIAEAEANVEEEDDLNPLEDEAPAEEKASEAQEQENAAEDESKPAEATRFSAKTQATARRMVKDFDLLAPTIRANVLQMLTDADGSNIDFGTLRALATVMSANENLLVTFAENTPTNAFAWHWTRESDEDYVGSTIVLRKQIAAKTDEAGKTVATSRQQIRRALAEELWHAVQRTRVADAVEKWVLKVYGQKAIDAEKKAYNDAWVATGREAITDDAWLTEEAYANLIARKMVTANFIDKLAAGNRSVAARIFSKVKALAKALADKDHRVDREIRDLYDLYEVALNTAINTENAIGAEIDEDTDSVTVNYNVSTLNASDYATDFKNAAKELAEAIGVSERKAKAYIKDVFSVANIITSEKNALDYEDSGPSPFVSNVEYGGSIDFNTLCPKRRLLTGTITEIQKALPNTVLSAQDFLKIRDMMDKAGLVVSCGKCYVEGARANMGEMTSAFLKLYEQYNPGKWVPNMAEINTPEGIENIRVNHPEIYEQYVYFFNHYGTLRSGDPTLFASQQKPKLFQARSAYKGEILDAFKNREMVMLKNANGGIRWQSFSDFELVHLLDAMQALTDMARVGLFGQAYTKVPEFVKAFGNTGLKINVSIDAWGVDENGNLIFNDKEGMPSETAFALREQFSKNVGTICCVYDDAQLLAALADDRIDFIIPFHRSQWKKSQYKAMGLPATTKDYTYQQNEKWLKPADHHHTYQGREVLTKVTNFMPNTYWDFSMTGKENAEKYLRMCAESGKRPKFYRFLVNNGDGSYSLQPDGSTDGYWKLLIDFKMYDNDGKASPQTAVRPDFEMDAIESMIRDYKGDANTFPVARGIVDEFVKQYKAENPRVRYSVEGATRFSKEENNRKPSASPDVRYALPAEMQEGEKRLETLRADAEKASKLAKEKKKIADSLADKERYDKMVDLLGRKDISKDEIDRALAEYKKWSDESGYGKAYDESSEADREYRKIQTEIERTEENLSKQLRQVEFTDAEAKEIAARAARAFHTTTLLNKAAYLTVNGSMLDFSDGQGYRVQDHREISSILELPDYAGYSDGMIMFMNMGNIRLQNYGIDISKSPNEAQTAALRGIIQSVMREYNEFSVDFSEKSGNTAGSVTYPAGTSSSKIISDIKSFFETGKVPEYNDDIARFRNARFSPEGYDAEYAKAIASGNEADQQRIVDNAAASAGAARKDGKPVHLYHGTGTFGFTTFRPGIIFTSTNSAVAIGYGGKYTNQRRASLKYRTDDGTMDTLIHNAKAVMNEEIRPYTEQDHERIVKEGRDTIQNLANKLNELDDNVNRKEWDSFWKKVRKEYGDEQTDKWYNAFSNLAYNPAGWQENIEEIVRGDNQFARDFVSDVQNYEKNRSILIDMERETDIQYWIEDRKTLDIYFDYLIGHQFLYGDAAIELETGLCRAIDSKEKVVYDNGFVNYADSVREEIETFKDSGMYDLYGFLGNNPLVVDAGRKHWRMIHFEGQIMTTDEIVEIAKKRGHTAVVIRNVMDPSVGSSNEYADDYVFFDSNQLKSADPVTYDDNGDIIPPSKRFDLSNNDVRFSPDGARGDRVYAQPKKMYTKAEIARFLQSIRETYGLENTKGKVQEAEIRAILDRISKLNWQVSVSRRQFDQAVSDVAGLILADTVDYFSIEDIGRIQEWIEEELLKGAERPSLTYMQELLDDNRRMKRFVQQAKQVIKTRDQFFTARGDVLRMAQELKRNYAKIARGAESILGDPALKQLMELMGKVSRGAYLNVTRAKEVCQFFEQFLLNRGDEAKLYLGDLSAKADEAFDVTQTQSFNDARMIAEGGGSLTTLEEMRALNRVMHTIKNLYDNFDKVLYQGKKVSASEMIEHEVNGVLNKSRTMNVLDRFNATFVTPETVAEIAEGSAKTGALRGYVRMLVTSQYSMQAQINEWSTPFDAFFNEHKKFRKALNEYSVEFEGKKISLGQAISLYELSKRSLTEASVAISSLEYKDENGKIQKIERQYTDMPTDPDEFYAWASEKALGVRASIAKMYTGFSDEAKEYIKLVETFFNKDSTAAKREADMRILGYTNVTDGFYFPAQRTGISHSLVDAGRVLAEDAVKAYNLSFNQQTVKNTRALTLKNVNEVVNEHMKGLAYYCNMYEVESSFDRFMNINIGTRQNPITVRSALDAKWKGGTKYFSNLFIDAQGGNQRTDPFSRAMSTVRSAFAQSALGMNIKVCITQAASYPTAYGYLDVPSLMKGIATGKNFIGGKAGEANVAEMQKYSVAARARYYKYGQSQIVLSEAVTARLLKGLEWTSWGINHVDKVTITALWAAAQYQIEKDEHLAFGTEENKARAGELLNDVINATQPTYIASTRSAAQRNQNEIVKAFMMFSSVVMKQTSMVVSSATRLYNYRHQIAESKKNGTNTDVTTKDVKNARVMMAKTMSALIVSNAIFVLMGMLINQGLLAKDYGKDDDESEGEALAKYFAQNFLGSMINIIPVAGTITNDIISGFDQNYFVYDNINTIVDAAGSMATAVMNAASGKEVHVSQYLRAAKSGIDALSQFTGIPTRNVFNAVTGIIKRVSPEAGADIDNAFWGGASSDMASAIRNGDEKMAGKLIDIVTREKTGASDRAVANEIARLYIGQTFDSGSYDSVVRTIGTTYRDAEGNEQTITGEQRGKIESMYSKATATVAKLIASPAYSALDDAQKASAIGKVYDATLKNAKHTVLGTSASGAAYGSLITTDASEYYAALAVLPTLTTTGKQTKKAAAMQYLNGRGISYFEKMLILWVSGYRGEETRKFLAAQIRRTGDEEKIAAAKEMGIIPQ